MNYRMLIFAILAPLMGAAANAASEDTVAADRVVFRVLEPGLDPYLETWLVSADYLRIDSGDPEAGHLIFQRSPGRIYSISHEEQSVLIVDAPSGDTSTSGLLGADLRLAQQQTQPKDAPTVGGQLPIEVTLLANDQLCVQLAVVKGLLPRVRQAMHDYQQFLSRQQRQVLSSFPPEQLTACRIAEDVVAPTRDLDLGFPIIRWRPDGSLREMRAYTENIQVAPGTFEIPEQYGQMNFQSGDFSGLAAEH